MLFGFAMLTCVVAPLAEEIFFRGFLFTTFARKVGPVWGALLAGSLFGLIHAPNPWLSLVALGVLGVCLCALYWRTQSIIPGMALHALNNSISFGYTKSLDPWLFGGLIVGSVVARGGDRHRRLLASGGRRMRRAAAVATFATLAAPRHSGRADASSHTDADASRGGADPDSAGRTRARRDRVVDLLDRPPDGRRGAHRTCLHGARGDEAVRRQREDHGPRLPRLQEDRGSRADTEGGQCQRRRRRDLQGQDGQARQAEDHRLAPGLRGRRHGRREGDPRAGRSGRRRRSAPRARSSASCRASSPRCTTPCRAAASSTPARPTR